MSINTDWNSLSNKYHHVRNLSHDKLNDAHLMINQV